MRTTEEEMNPNARLSFIESIRICGIMQQYFIFRNQRIFTCVLYKCRRSKRGGSSVYYCVFKNSGWISDLAMGYIVDHTNSKWGKARPMDCKTLHSACSMYCPDVQCARQAFYGKAQLVYMFLTYNLVSTVFYTGINVPYATMHGLMTTNQYERGLLGNFQKSSCYGGNHDDQYSSYENDRIFWRWGRLLSERLDNDNGSLDGSVCYFEYVYVFYL